MTDPDSPRTCTLTDGHAGNVRQAVALAQAMEIEGHEAVVLEPNVAARSFAPRRFPCASRSLGRHFAAVLAAPPAFALGCGRQGALATRLLRAQGSRVVQILDPRIDPRHWDVVVAPEHDALSAANVVTLLGSLHPVDDAWLAAAREEFASFAHLPAPRTALLLGGPTRHARHNDDAIASFLDWLRERQMLDGGSVLATTSRRTPPALAARLRTTLSDVPGFTWAGEADGANPYAGVLAWADRIVCSADSVNMLSEAAATTAPLYVAGADRVQGRPRRFVDALIASSRARACLGALDPYPVTPLRETARVAAQVRARLGLQR